MSAMGTEMRARDCSRYAVAFFKLAQAVHPDSVPDSVPACIFLVRNSNVSAHSASRWVRGLLNDFRSPHRCPRGQLRSSVNHRRAACQTER
jgi:hypothetical protein